MIGVFFFFEGPIPRRDVGDLMFETFRGPGCTEIVTDYREEKLTAVECFRKECDACGVVDKPRLDAFLDEQEIDPAFGGFVRFCEANSVSCTTLSDGMDYYIRRILSRAGLDRVDSRSNVLRFGAAGQDSVRFVPEFPYTDEVCTRCASCKRNHMVDMS